MKPWMPTCTRFVPRTRTPDSRMPRMGVPLDGPCRDGVVATHDQRKERLGLAQADLDALLDVSQGLDRVEDGGRHVADLTDPEGTDVDVEVRAEGGEDGPGVTQR